MVISVTRIKPIWWMNERDSDDKKKKKRKRREIFSTCIVRRIDVIEKHVQSSIDLKKSLKTHTHIHKETRSSLFSLFSHFLLLNYLSKSIFQTVIQTPIPFLLFFSSSTLFLSLLRLFVVYYFERTTHVR